MVSRMWLKTASHSTTNRLQPLTALDLQSSYGLVVVEMRLKRIGPAERVPLLSRELFSGKVLRRIPACLVQPTAQKGVDLW